MTWCALYVWLPELLNAALDHDDATNWNPRLARLDRQCGFYHVLAISIPPLAVAWLVLYHNSDDKAPLAVVSMVALLGLVVLVWISRQVLRRLATLRQLSDRLAEIENRL